MSEQYLLGEEYVSEGVLALAGMALLAVVLDGAGVAGVATQDHKPIRDALKDSQFKLIKGIASKFGKTKEFIQAKKAVDDIENLPKIAAFVKAHMTPNGDIKAGKHDEFMKLLADSVPNNGQAQLRKLAATIQKNQQKRSGEYKKIRNQLLNKEEADVESGKIVDFLEGFDEVGTDDLMEIAIAGNLDAMVNALGKQIRYKVDTATAKQIIQDIMAGTRTRVDAAKMKELVAGLVKATKTNSHSGVFGEDYEIDCEILLNEASQYKVVHPSYTSAVQEVEKYAEKRGFEIDPEEMAQKVGLGPSKPSEGKTNRFNLSLTKGGKEQKKALQFQIYGMGKGKYELNAYIN